MVAIFARLAAERGKLGDELAERPGVGLSRIPLDPRTVVLGEPPLLVNPLLDTMLWYWPQRGYAMDIAERLYPGE